MEVDFKPWRMLNSLPLQARASAAMAALTYPKCGPVLATRNLQPVYNSRARYLVVSGEHRPHKSFVDSNVAAGAECSMDSMKAVQAFRASAKRHLSCTEYCATVENGAYRGAAREITWQIAADVAADGLSLLR